MRRCQYACEGIWTWDNHHKHHIEEIFVFEENWGCGEGHILDGEGGYACHYIMIIWLCGFNYWHCKHYIFVPITSLDPLSHLLEQCVYFPILHLVGDVIVYCITINQPVSYLLLSSFTGIALAWSKIPRYWFKCVLMVHPGWLAMWLYRKHFLIYLHKLMLFLSIISWVFLFH